MKKIIVSIIALAFIAGAAINIQVNLSHANISKLALANVEALADGESFNIIGWGYLDIYDFTWRGVSFENEKCINYYDTKTKFICCSDNYMGTQWGECGKTGTGTRTLSCNNY